MRKIFGLILFLLGIFVIIVAITPIFTKTSFNYYPEFLLFLYVFWGGGWHLIRTKASDDPIPAWKKWIIYPLVWLGCVAVGAIVGTIFFPNNVKAVEWISLIMVFALVPTNIIRNFLLDWEYKKHPELKPKTETKSCKKKDI